MSNPVRDAFRNAAIEVAAREVIAAYDEFMDTDIIDRLAAATGKLRQALNA